MPNYCDYGMAVRGYKDNVEEFIRIIQADYNYDTNEFTHNRHFFRVFESIVEEDYITYGLERCVKIYGYCAWSVYSCMFPGPFTYYGYTVDQNSSLYESAKNIKYGTHILQESKRLNLQIEIFSAEPGMGFQEYYYIANGNTIRNEENELNMYWLENIENDYDVDDVEDFCNKYNLNKNEVLKAINNGETEYSPDQIDWIFNIDEPSKVLARNVMIFDKKE